MISFIKVLPFVGALALSTFAAPAPNTNILIPNENGELVYATPTQLAARSAVYGTFPLSKRDACSDQTVPSDAFNCNQYCEHSAQVIQGPGVKGRFPSRTVISMSPTIIWLG